MLIDCSLSDTLAYPIDRHYAVDTTMGLNYYASSPVVLPPQNHNHHMVTQQHHEGGAILTPSPSAFQQQSFPAKKFVSKYPTPPSLNYLARPSTGVAGRKRSRDDVNDDHESELEASTRPLSLAVSNEPVMGPNNTLLYPDEPSPLTIPADQHFQNPNGTWSVQSTDHIMSIAPAERPQIVARKSQRTLSDGPPTSTHEEIDPIVRQLGIGWKRPSESQAPAIAGSETFIRNQYHLHQVTIVLHHEGLGIYVVRSEPANAKGYWHQWWLFRDDLKSSRFLCNDDSDLFRRLNNKRQDERGNWIPDILVEGPEVFAKDTPPSPVTALSPVNGVAMAENVEQMVLQAPCQDVEMA